MAGGAPPITDTKPHVTVDDEDQTEGPLSAPTLKVDRDEITSYQSKPRNDNEDLLIDQPKALRYDMFTPHDLASESTKNKGSARRYEGAQIERAEGNDDNIM